MAFRAKRPESAVSRIDQGAFPFPWDPEGEARLVIRRAGSEANAEWSEKRKRLVPRPPALSADVAGLEAKRILSREVHKATEKRRTIRNDEFEKIHRESLKEASARAENMSTSEYARAEAAIRAGTADTAAHVADFDETRLRVAECLIVDVTGYPGADWTDMDARVELCGFSGAKLRWLRSERVEYLTRRQMESPPEMIAAGLKSGSIVVDRGFDGEWLDENGRKWFFPDGPCADQGPGEAVVKYADDCAGDLEEGRGPTLAAARLDWPGSAAGTTAA